MGSYLSQFCVSCSDCFKRRSTPDFIDTTPVDDVYILMQDKENVDITKVSELKVKTSGLVTKKTMDPMTIYNIQEQIGTGSFGTVQKVVHKTAGQPRAMKIIPKAHLKKGVSQDKLDEEISILKELDHPNIMKIYEFFEDEYNFYLISEMCDEGDLNKKLKNMKSLNEILVKFFMYQILSAVTYLHSKKLVHGDIKLENIMVYSTTTSTKHFFNTLENDAATFDMEQKKQTKLNTSTDSKLKAQLEDKAKAVLSSMLTYEVKLMDFGCSKLFSGVGKRDLRGIIGTSIYCSPEVIDDEYSEKCDEWACGVVMYYLLGGVPPFSGETEEELFRKIKKGKFTFDPKLTHISKQGKDLISKLLTYNPDSRITAKEALNHPFFTENVNPNAVFRDSNDLHLLSELKKQTKKGKFQEVVLAYVSHNFANKNEVQKLRKLFRYLDTNSDGIIVRQELIKGLKDSGENFTEQEIKEVLETFDSDQNGCIEYEELLRCLLDKKILLNDNNLKAAFQLFDLNDDLSITWNEIESIIFKDKKVDPNLKTEFLAEIQKKEDDEITFPEFCKIMREIK